MILREFLEQSDKNTDYFIGAEDGGGFFYIGPPKRALKDIISIQKKAKHDVKATYERAREELKNLKAQTPKTSQTEYHKSQVKRKTENLNNLRARVKNWKPLLDREIIDVRPKTIEPGMIVIVSGFCTGNCWSSWEYDKTRENTLPKIDLHRDGVEDLRGAILELAASDYKNTIAHKFKNGSEPLDPLLTSYSLKSFFTSKWFEDLCNLDGEEVVKAIEEQAIKEEIEKLNQKKEEACNG